MDFVVALFIFGAVVLLTTWLPLAPKRMTIPFFHSVK